MKQNPKSTVSGSPLFADATAAAAQNNPAALFMNPFSYYPNDPSSKLMINRKDSNLYILYGHQHINEHSNTAFPFVI